MSKNSKVQIIADDMGNKIRVSKNNPEYAHVRIVQEKTWIAPSGWVRKREMSTLLHGTVDDLKDIGISKMKYLPGQIVIKEQCEPFNEENPDRDLKMAGDTGVICCRHGEPIYRKCFYDATCTDTDELIHHTNSSDIKKANKSDSEGAKKFFNVKEPSEKTDPNQVDLEDSIAEVEEDNTSMINDDDESVENEEEEVIEEEEEVTEEIEEGNTSFEL